MKINSKTFLYLIFLLVVNSVCAQGKTIKLVFSPAFGLQPFDLVDSSFTPEGWIDLNIETLKFYVSNIRFLNNNEVVFGEPISVHLLDARDVASMALEIDLQKDFDFNTLEFDLGIDSTRNVSGAMGGDLDPTNGMYWTWQSGYINFKLEGRSKASPARNKEYLFHLGGYQFPYNSLKTIHLLVDDRDIIHIDLDIENFLNEMDLSLVNHVMSPGTDALILSSIVSESFKVREE